MVFLLLNKLSFTKGNNSHTKSKFEIIFTYPLEITSDNENLPILLTKDLNYASDRLLFLQTTKREFHTRANL